MQEASVAAADRRVRNAIGFIYVSRMLRGKLSFG